MKSYRTYLNAIGRRPVPPYQKLRTVKTPGSVEVTHRGLHVHEGE